MARPVFEKGPITFSVTSAANLGAVNGIKELTLVEPDGTTGRIKVAVAGTFKCIGVAVGNASASDFANADTTDFWGNNVTNFHYPPNEVAVAYQGVWLLRNEGGSVIDFGDLVVVAGVTTAAGGVGKFTNAVAGAVSNVAAVVGRCVEPGGIAATSGTRGKILLGGLA
jgi:hypothetical protein